MKRPSKVFHNTKAHEVLGIHPFTALKTPEIHDPSWFRSSATAEIWSPSIPSSIQPLLGNTATYPPQDRGKAAWTFLFGACLIEVVSWAFPSCFGVFRQYYFSHPPFQGLTVLINVGPITDGCIQISTPLVLAFVKTYPEFIKRTMWLGMVLCILASIGAAISTKPWQLITTQGALYGFGAGLLTAPVPVYMSQWFDKRQSLAYGLMLSASGIFGSFLPTLYNKLLYVFGQKITLFGHAGFVAILTTIALFCIHPRVPYQETISKDPSRKTDARFLKDISFYLLGGSVLIQGIALKLPAIFLPSFVIGLNYKSTQGALALSMFNLATASGQVGLGILA
jgi:MFS family permease